VYKEECAAVDAGCFSDEDVGIHVPAEDDPEWAELEALMTKKGLVFGKKEAANVVEPAPVRKKQAAPRSPKRKMSMESLGPEETDSPAVKSKRIVKTAEASAALPRKAQSIPVDEHGYPVLPVTCGIVTVHELGQVVSDRQTYHNKRYVWPVGFRSSRQYQSCTDPEGTATYVSEVKDGGAAPIFEVWQEPETPPEDDVIAPRFQSSTSTGAWTSVFKAAAAVRGKELTNSASGPDFFGFSNNTIQMMIEMLPGVENCLNYQKKNFETGLMAMGGKSANGRSSQQHDVAQSEDTIDLFDIAARAMQQMTQ